MVTGADHVRINAADHVRINAADHVTINATATIALSRREVSPPIFVSPIRITMRINSV